VNSEPPRLTLYQRAGCHLCEEMREDLAPWCRQLRLRLVDVDTSPELQRSYGELVPVLAGPDGVEICRYFLDGERLERYLAESGITASG
jgi:hypothetical protein